jgi:hypothetical protein
MCPNNLLYLILIIAIVPALFKLHFSISQNQNADITDTYELSSGERLFDILTFLLIFGSIGTTAWLFISGKSSIIYEEIRNEEFLGTIIALLFVVIFGSVVALRSYETRTRIRSWLKQNGLEATRFYWNTFFHPWMRDSSGFFDGTSDSQSVYKIEVLTPEGKAEVVYLLWGSYFGLCFFTGKIPVNLIWKS